MPGIGRLQTDVRQWIVDGLFVAMQWYVRRSPFRRGAGVFLRPLRLLRKRRWPAPASRLRGGLQMEFEESLLGWVLVQRGEWEPDQTQAFLDRLRPGAVVLNVGANTGYYSLLAAAAVGPGGQVHAFEIQPDIVARLRRNVARNRLGEIVTVIPAGCYSAPGTACIEHRGDPGSARIQLDGSGTSVPLTTLDLHVAQRGLQRVDFILVDAEGADFEVLKGARDILRRFHPTVMIEAHHLEAFGGSVDVVRAFMADYGYSVRALSCAYSNDLLFQPRTPVTPAMPQLSLAG